MRILMIIAALAAGLLCMGFIPFVTMSAPSMEIHYKDYNGRLPKRGQVWICHGSGCEWKVPFRFSRKDYEYLRASFSNIKSAKQERMAVRNAIAWLERRVCKAAGTCRDKAGASWFTSKIPGQLECLDESMNTTSYLLTLKRWGLLRHHEVLTPLHVFGIDRFPHWTARLRDGSGRHWAVDSYFEPNGAVPDVIPASIWAKGRRR